MVDHEKYRNDLLDGAIRATAEKGLEGITTRAIADAVKLNEAYIYRYYLDRNDLLEKAFLRSDRNFIEVVARNWSILTDDSRPFKERFFDFFDKSWNYAVEDYAYCLFYVRFYYSTFYTDRAREEHARNVRERIPSLQNYFLEDADPNLVRHHLFVSSLSYIMEIATHRRPDTPEERDKICRLLYCTLVMNLDPKKIPNFE